MADRNITDYLGFEYDKIPLWTTPKELMELWKKAYEQGKAEGFIPVIIPIEDRLEDYLEDMEGQEISADSLPDVKDFFASAKQSIDDIDSYKGTMTAGDPNDLMVSMTDYESGELAECVMIHLPTDKPWEAALLVPFGGWNDCPTPDDMAAVLKYWYEQYGAVPAAITHDTLEMVLPQPISREDAAQVAFEQFLFCTDRVTQCTKSGTIGELAGDLSVSTVWYFWWD